MLACSPDNFSRPLRRVTITAIPTRTSNTTCRNRAFIYPSRRIGRTSLSASQLFFHYRRAINSDEHLLDVGRCIGVRLAPRACFRGALRPASNLLLTMKISDIKLPDRYEEAASCGADRLSRDRHCRDTCRVLGHLSQGLGNTDHNSLPYHLSRFFHRYCRHSH